MRHQTHLSVEVSLERGNGEFRFKQGTLYPLLYRLEREGWIRANWETPPKGKKRKVYTLTAEGRKEQRARTKEWIRAFVEASIRKKRKGPTPRRRHTRQPDQT